MFEFPRFLSHIPLRIHCEGAGAGGGGGAGDRTGFSEGAAFGRAGQQAPTGVSGSRGGVESLKASRRKSKTRGGLESSKSVADIAAAVDVGVAAGGAGLGGTPTPVIPPPPPPPPTTETKDAQNALNRSLVAERKRRGRRATILTSPRGIQDQLGVINRPQARGAELLGG